MERRRIAVIVGTRPEAIKMAPVVHALKKYTDELDTVVVATGQHRQMLDQALGLFQITPDVDLNLMRPNQGLAELTSNVLQQIEPALRTIGPDLLLVQGDTTTVFAAALVGFYLQVPVAHVEAGLRSHERYNPFPEEMNRRLTSVLSSLHFAPTPLAKHKLLGEGVAEESIVVTGNTVVDALLTQLNAPFTLGNTPLAAVPFDGHRVLLVTSHRRETWGQDLQDVCLALQDLVARHPDVIVVYPVHLNPRVRGPVMELLTNRDRIFLTDPLDYLTCLNLMRRAYLILTDSGGIQEEAPALQKPVLVLRQLTERPEAYQAGMAVVVGTSRAAIVEVTGRLLSDPESYRTMAEGNNPFGDGRAAERIAIALCRWAQGQWPLLQPHEEFVPGRMNG